MAIYIIFTKTGKEEYLKNKLEEQVIKPGEEAYILLCNRIKKINGEYTVVTKPLFPGYLFINTENEEDLKKYLRKLPIYNILLGSGNDVVPLNKQEEIFMDRLCGKNHILDISYGYKVGRVTHITSGPLVGMESFIKKINRHKRIAVIEIDMFNERRELIVGASIADKEEEVNTTSYGD